MADFYDLTVGQLQNLERLGEKSAQNIISGIQSSKQVPFERVLFALSIKHVGETVQTYRQTRRLNGETNYGNRRGVDAD